VTQLVERNWQTLAACRSADPDLFFPLSSSGKSLGQVTERIGFQSFSNRLLAHAALVFRTTSRPSGSRLWERNGSSDPTPAAVRRGQMLCSCLPRSSDVRKRPRAAVL
jgi:hypothetical protein